MKKQFPERILVACMELHTFSSLNKDFLNLYHQSMSAADQAIVYFNKETIKHKKLDDLSENEVKEAFGTDNIKVYTSSEKLIVDLKSKNWVNANLLMMSSGNFDGIDFKEFAKNIIH